MIYRSVVVTRLGGPEVFQVIENNLRAPAQEEARIKVLAAPVSQPDVEARYGRTPFPPKIPFVPGYAIVGRVDAVGSSVREFCVGDKVAALTAYGGYSEYIYIKPSRLIPVPAGVDPVAAAPLIENYVLAYQTLHRLAKVKAGDRILIVGASGGIGTAYLQLGKLAALRVYGIASKSKHPILAEYGATPIDYRTQSFVDVIHRLEPDGIDAVFDGMGGDYIDRGVSVLRRGGIFVEYGNPLTFSRMLRLVGKVIQLNLRPNGISVQIYGNSSVLNMRPFQEDWATLFQLLGDGKIRPVIHKTFPILEAAQANAFLESGQVVGNVVLVSPELLE